MVVPITLIHILARMGIGKQNSAYVLNVLVQRIAINYHLALH